MSKLLLSVLAVSRLDNLVSKWKVQTMMHLPKSMVCLLLLGVFQFCTLEAQAAPPASVAVYEWRSDLGGWLDTSNNLVWGYATMGIENTPVTHSQAQAYALNYSSALLSAGYEYEAGVASLYSWRLPSLPEYQDAYNKGLFWEEGDTGIYDQSPADGFQSPSYGYLKWTSTLGTKRDNKRAYYFETTWGSSGTATTTSGLNAIFVRKHIP